MSDGTLHSSALGICQRAMAILRQENRLTSIAPNAPTKVERACYYAYESSRLEVIGSFGWSFLKNDKLVNGSAMDEDGRYVTPFPSDALKVLACYDESGKKVSFSVRHNEKILSLKEIRRIVYTFDDDDADAYPHLVQDALVKTLAKNVCMEITGRPADFQLVSAQASQAVQVARTDDARLSETGSEVYGRNYLYDCMCGRVNPFRRRSI